MRERDKKFKDSPKLQLAAGAGLIGLAIVGFNIHDEAIGVAALNIVGIVVSAALVTRGAVCGIESWPVRQPTNFVPSSTPQEESR